MNQIRQFSCSICGEPSTEICVYCTKDACPNHLCPPLPAVQRLLRVPGAAGGRSV
jgi:hypothetical protein